MEESPKRKQRWLSMVEVQDVFNEFGVIYRQSHKLPLHIHKAMNAIEKCRSSALGSHTDICDSCGFHKISYNSCRNRHCPKCQALTKEKWIYDRKFDLLNVKYFHVVFTIPDTLNTIAFHNQKLVYDILFKAVSETLLELSADKKYLGAKIGFTSILHTWGQNLMHHPHIHCIVPSGGLDSLNKWKDSKYDFFLPVKVLSRKFRGKFLYYLKLAKLDFYGDDKYLYDTQAFESYLSSLYKKEWVVYCKSPFKNANFVIEYLGRYTHRVAISNNHILKLENGHVSFKWRDYKDSSKWKVMTVSAVEFIRRFLIHILPPRFMKIRHYGLLGNRNKSTKLILCKKLTFTKILKKEKLPLLELIKKLIGKDFSICPACGIGHLVRDSPT